jgi:flagellar biosynthesis component FlhA
MNTMDYTILGQLSRDRHAELLQEAEMLRLIESQQPERSAAVQSAVADNHPLGGLLTILRMLPGRIRMA